MLRALFGLVPIKRGRVIVRVDIDSSHETARNFIRGNAFLGNRINLNPVARRQQQRFGAAGLAQDRFGRRATGELLPRRHVGDMMT